MYKQDVFYNIDKLSFKRKIQLLNEAKSLCTKWWMDILDCSKSWQRKKINISFEDAISKINKDTLYTFIYRRFPDFERHLEVVFRTMTLPDYFLWIIVDENKIKDFIVKFNLKEKQ